MAMEVDEWARRRLKHFEWPSLSEVLGWVFYRVFK